MAESILNNAKALAEYIRKQRIIKQQEEGITGSKIWKSTKMYTYDIEGKKIKTNFGAGSYQYWDGNGGAPHETISVTSRITSEEMLKRLIDKGYTTIQIKLYANRIVCDTVFFYS